MKFYLSKLTSYFGLIVTLMAFELFSSVINSANAQENRADYIRSVKLYRQGDQTSFPVLILNSADVLELDFDDMSNTFRNYYYTFQLCNADWSPSMLHSFEYISGFENNRITTYRNSSISNARYIYYQAMLPDRNCYPNKSGNYLLKVFIDNDTSNLVFSRRMIVVDNQASISAQIQQPYSASLFNVAQKLQVSMQMSNRVQTVSPNDFKVTILQNHNWETSVFLERPTIIRGNYFEYSDELQTSMPAGKEFRWVDLRSLRLMSDRMLRMENKGDTTDVVLKPDPARADHPYVYYRDLNGSYTIESLENINPFWQADYARVHFSYFPPAGKPIEGKDVFIMGEMTNFSADNTGKMSFNPDRGAYEKTLLLKQGFYNYIYVTRPMNGKGFPDFSQTEGNYWGTENNYTILVYYRPFGARYDQLIGYASINSMFQRNSL